MKPKLLLLLISLCIFILLSFPVVADTPYAHKRGEFSSHKHWQRGNNSYDSRSYKSNHGSHRSAERRKFKSWQSSQHYSEQPRSKPYRASDERKQRSPGNETGDGNTQRRSPRPRDEAPPPRQERRKPHPEHSSEPRHKDRDQKPPHNHQRDHRNEKYRSDKRHDHANNHKPYNPPSHDYRHQHRPHRPHYKPPYQPRHRLYKRHRYIYYRTPWYSTWFLAPIPWHYHGIGFTLEILPSPYVRIVVGGLPYFYAHGAFYRPYRSGYIVVTAPIGAVVTTLPMGYIAFSVGLDTYYFVNNTYYIWDEPRTGFVVVPKPEGADDAIEEATRGRLYVYPNKGQSEEQQAKDRYTCHQWAVSESDVDPTLEEQDYSDREKREYKRAMAACLEGRGYTVK